MQENSSLTFTLLHFIVSGISLILTAKLINNFKVSGIFSAFLASIVLALANSFVWPLLIFLTLPINVLTLGLFTFVVNGAIINLASWLTPGFEVNSWLAAIFGSIILSFFNMILHFILV